MSRKPLNLNPAERRLLRLIQQDCTISAEELGARCGMSTSTVLRRLKTFRRTGVIRAEVALLDPAAVGRPLIFVTAVRLERDNEQVVQNFLSWVARNEAITQCYFVTGAADYILHISACDMEEYDDLVQDLVNNPHIAMSETNVVIRPIKMSLAVPLGD